MTRTRPDFSDTYSRCGSAGGWATWSGWRAVAMRVSWRPAAEAAGGPARAASAAAGRSAARAVTEPMVLPRTNTPGQPMLRPGLGGEALFRASPPLRRLDVAILRRRRGRELARQPGRHRGDVVDRPRERLGIGLGGLVEAADLADVLQRGLADLLIGRRGLEVVEVADVSAHGQSLEAHGPQGHRRSHQLPVGKWRRPGRSRSQWNFGA